MLKRFEGVYIPFQTQGPRVNYVTAKSIIISINTEKINNNDDDNNNNNNNNNNNDDNEDDDDDDDDGDDEDKRERAVTLSSEMEALKTEDAYEIDDTCACLKVGTH